MFFFLPGLEFSVTRVAHRLNAIDLLRFTLFVNDLIRLNALFYDES